MFALSRFWSSFDPMRILVLGISGKISVWVSCACLCFPEPTAHSRDLPFDQSMSPLLFSITGQNPTGSPGHAVSCYLHPLVQYKSCNKHVTKGASDNLLLSGNSPL